MDLPKAPKPKSLIAEELSSLKLKKLTKEAADELKRPMEGGSPLSANSGEFDLDKAEPHEVEELWRYVRERVK